MEKEKLFPGTTDSQVGNDKEAAADERRGEGRDAAHV